MGDEDIPRHLRDSPVSAPTGIFNDMGRGLHTYVIPFSFPTVFPKLISGL
jgi:hypothetical protein